MPGSLSDVQLSVASCAILVCIIFLPSILECKLVLFSRATESGAGDKLPQDLKVEEASQHLMLQGLGPHKVKAAVIFQS